MQDDRIVELYWKRNEAAIQYTDQKYGRYLMKLSYNILADWEDSKESVNDTYPEFPGKSGSTLTGGPTATP